MVELEVGAGGTVQPAGERREQKSGGWATADMLVCQLICPIVSRVQVLSVRLLGGVEENVGENWLQRMLA